MYPDPITPKSFPDRLQQIDYDPFGVMPPAMPAHPRVHQTHLRGVWLWGPLYNLAYDAYEDPKYAWLLNRMERDYPTRRYPGLPMPLQTHHGDLDFPRIREIYPEGTFDLSADASFAPRARHAQGCTLLPMAGPNASTRKWPRPAGVCSGCGPG